MELTKDEKEELKDIEEEIAEGSLEAKLHWAEFYMEGHPRCVTPEIAAKAVKYYEENIEAGDMEAALNLGALYYRGNLVDQNYPKAIELYKRAASGDDDSVAGIACSNLGYCFYYGRDIPKDYKEAFKYWSKAALVYEDPSAMYKLGDMYRAGQFMEKDEKMAFALYVKAEENSYEGQHAYPDICSRLGKAYLYGTICEKNVYKAYEFLSKAELYTMEKLRNMDPFAKKLLPKIQEMLNLARKELMGEL